MTFDRFYQNLFDKTGDMDFVVKAGWFEDGVINLDPQLDFYATPLHQIMTADTKEVSVLYYMGCFAPVHEGHLKAMQIAKETVEQQTGETVVAGFFAPDHDSYVGQKTQDPRFFAPNRVAYMQEQLKGQDSWMQVDVWPALYAPKDLNFTVLYDRFTAYLQKWLPEDVKVKLYCVFGGDNYQFANAFTEYGYGVCVGRGGVQMDMTAILPNPRVLWAESVSTSHSSTAVRAAMVTVDETPSEEDYYVLRDDLDCAFTPPRVLSNKVISDAVRILVTAHVDAKVKTIAVKDQLAQFHPERPFISLDCFLDSDYKLDITRVFELSDPQRFSHFHTNRAGTPPIDEQVKNIPEGYYDLVDDDIATGATMKMMESFLNLNNVKVTNFLSLLDNQENEENLYDILDMRDFILGAKHGGLTVRTVKNEITRMPYALPYVNLATRAKMSPLKMFSLSIEIWKLNSSTYHGTGMTIADIKEYQDFTLLGFPADMTVEELCDKHIELLTGKRK